MEPLPSVIQKLYEEGDGYKDGLLKALNDWPRGEYSKLIEFKTIEHNVRETIDAALVKLHRWLHNLWLEIKHYSLYDQERIVDIFVSLQRKIKEAEYLEAVTSEVNEFMDHVSFIIRSTPFPETLGELSPANVQMRKYKPNTAFIIMWMDKTNHQLEDVCNTIKDVCTLFDINAIRSDDVENSEKITDTILENIAASEFIIADLTGERPNVYYEVGYAHALNKRTVFYRKEGTNLHFDLANYQVREYKNMTDLKEKLIKRFSSITSRKPR